MGRKTIRLKIQRDAFHKITQRYSNDRPTCAVVKNSSYFLEMHNPISPQSLRLEVSASAQLWEILTKVELLQLGDF